MLSIFKLLQPSYGRIRLAALGCSAMVLIVCGCGGTHTIVPPPASTFQLTVQSGGTGSGTITSAPSGISCGQTCSASFASAASVTLTAAANSGSSFAGWSGACSGTATCTVSMTANESVTATFTTSAPAQVQLTVADAGTGTGTVTSSPAGINCGSTCSASFASGTSVTLTAAAGSGSTFAGWSGACTGTGTCTVNLTAASAVTATFNTSVVPPVQLTVADAGTGAGTITSSPSGINCGATCSASFASGTQVTLTAAATSGSTFAGWSGACTGTGTCTVNLTTNSSVTATFTTSVAPTVQLTVQSAGTGTGTVISSPSGISCPTTCSASFASGTRVTLTDAVNANSTFGGWTGACTGTGACVVTLTANTTVGATFTAAPPPVQLTVVDAGTGTGTVTSAPAGINCGSTCSDTFPSGTQVTLTATAASGSTFAGWTGACSGQATCALTLTAAATATATFSTVAGLSSINHIIFMSQENRSLDNYFGAMRQYWAANGIPDQSFDGLPQFNPATGIKPLQGPVPALPGCDPTQPLPSDCVWDPTNLVPSFHFNTVCNENTSPSWNEAHVDWDFGDQVGKYKAKNNGFVWTAAHDARTNYPTPFFDVSGIRTMGYWDGTDLNYDYFMATNFATSDRFFQPAMTRTQPNRWYQIAATSQGHAYPPPPAQNPPVYWPPLTSKTIFEELTDAGISWRIYVNPGDSANPVCPGPPYDPACLMTLSYLQQFTYGHTVVQNYPQNIAPISQYFTDLQNGTLPQVVQIEPASDVGEDEHGSDSDTGFPTDVQYGVHYVSTLINALMDTATTANNYWSDSAFILTYDESGGMYDHVPPQPAVLPGDGFDSPTDLHSDSVCHAATGPTCKFAWTGDRVPLIVVSPYAKQNYVSHTVMDTTAILKLIETRFGLAPLTNRDKAQPDMTEYFDFNNPPWMTPPTPPQQTIYPVTGPNSQCYLNTLP